MAWVRSFGRKLACLAGSRVGVKRCSGTGGRVWTDVELCLLFLGTEELIEGKSHGRRFVQKAVQEQGGVLAQQDS